MVYDYYTALQCPALKVATCAAAFGLRVVCSVVTCTVLMYVA